MSPTKKQYWKTKKFSKLSAKWDNILTKEGFKDVEKTVGGERVLTASGNPLRDYESQDVVDAKIGYFRALGHLIHAKKFDSQVDKLILTRHSEGRLIKEICQELANKGYKLNRWAVGKIISRYEKKWGIVPWNRPRTR